METKAEPKGELLRRGQIVEWVGVSTRTFDDVVRSGVLPQVKFAANGKAYYLKADVKRVFLGCGAPTRAVMRETIGSEKG